MRADTADALLAMPFLETLETDDVLALRAIHSLAWDPDERLLTSLLEHRTVRGGITDDHTTLVAALGTLDDAVFIRRFLIPENVYIRTFERPTELSPNMRISIVRFGVAPQHWTRDMIRDAVEYTEQIMAEPLPVNHVIFVIDDKAVIDKFAGTNFGFAISGLPRLADGHSDDDKRRLASLILHEVAHYYWRGNANWLDEGGGRHL